MNLKKVIYYVFCCFVIVILLYIGKDSLLHRVGNFLVVKDDLRPVDAIVVLGGDSDRVVQAANLYQKGFAHFIIISGSNPYLTAEGMRMMAIKAGVPVERILLEPKARHTFQHPLFVKPILLDHGFTSVIVVSSPYHMRRAAMLFNGEFHGTNIRLIYYPVIHDWFDVNNWWKSDRGRKTVVSEYVKMTINSLGCDVNEFLYTFFRLNNYS